MIRRAPYGSADFFQANVEVYSHSLLHTNDPQGPLR